MAAGAINAFSRAKNPSMPNAGTMRARLRLSAPLLAMGRLILLLGCAGVVRGADPYSSALDKRFSTETTPSQTPNSGVAALEEGLKQQVHEMSQPPEPSHSTADAEARQQSLLTAFVATALGVGLVALMALQRWNQRLMKPVTGSARAMSVMAEDPTMEEFLRAMHERPQIPSIAIDTASAKPATPDTVLGPTLERQSSSVLDPQQAIALLGKQVAALRADFLKLGRAPGDAERLRIIHGLLEHTELVKEGASLPDLRSLWLLASSLRGLWKQLSTKAANITPSALRTSAAAIDLLEQLCTPGPRPDLSTGPPVRLLAVDDDLISRRTISLALKKAFSEPDLAADGLSALVFAAQQTYDLIFLDVEMSGMDGFEVCSKLHETALNRTTPVVFVTSHTDFDSRAKCALLGGHDLIGKPFLAFEISLKALTLVLKARLEGRDSKPAPSEPEKPALATPAEAILVPVENAATPSIPPPSQSVTPSATTSCEQIPGETTPKNQNAATTPSTPEPAVTSVSPAPPHPSDADFVEQPQPSSREFARAFFAGAPAHLQLLRNKVASARDLAQSAERDELLGELFIGVHGICSEAGRAHLGAAFRVGCALEAMLKKVVERPKLCTPSILDTATAALETMEQLCQAGNDLDLAQAPVRLLVVDDDPVARRAIGGALQLAFGRPDSADCGEAALALAEDKPYDLIFLDVLMPGMDGFSTCSRLHAIAMNRLTPVIFVTSQNDTDSRAQAVASGGCGFIPKPVLPAEIMLLALTHIVRSRLESRTCEPWERANTPQDCQAVLAG